MVTTHGWFSFVSGGVFFSGGGIKVCDEGCLYGRQSMEG